MTRITLLIFLLAISLPVLADCPKTQAAETPPSGESLYKKKLCAACHGREGEGGAAGPSLKNLGKSKEEITSLMKKGTQSMRPFKGTEEELSAIVDYVLSLR